MPGAAGPPPRDSGQEAEHKPSPHKGMPVDASAARVTHYADDLAQSKTHQAFGGQVGAAFLTAAVASAALYRYGDPSPGSMAEGSRGQLAGGTYGERVMATYARRLRNGVTLLQQAGDFVMDRGGQGKASACHKVKKRLDCQAAGCVWDTAKGCLGIEEELEASLKLQDERKQERQRRAERQRREEEDKAARKSKEALKEKEKEAKRKAAAEGSACEDASMQHRSNCKANSKCVYDTARGCYTKEEQTKHREGAEKKQSSSGSRCEDAAMQRRKNCKQNPDCVYDTALGCYSRK